MLVLCAFFVLFLWTKFHWILNTFWFIFYSWQEKFLSYIHIHNWYLFLKLGLKYVISTFILSSYHSFVVVFCNQLFAFLFWIFVWKIKVFSMTQRKIKINLKLDKIKKASVDHNYFLFTSFFYSGLFSNPEKLVCLQLQVNYQKY